MEARIMGYLEEYARALRVEFDSLMDRCLTDRDTQAGVEAEAIVRKIKDIKHIIKAIAYERAKHL